MWNTLGTMVSGTFEARPVGGTSGEVGFKTKVYGRAVGEETIEDLKKDSFVKSSFLNNTNCCSYVCSDDSGPLLWTSEARFEDDDKASGVATKITLKLRFRPKGCIVCPDEETGSNIPLHCLWPTTCIAMVIMLPCIYLCNQSTFEAGYSQQRAMVSSLSKSKFSNMNTQTPRSNTGKTKSKCNQGRNLQRLYESSECIDLPDHWKHVRRTTSHDERNDGGNCSAAPDAANSTRW